MSAPTGSETGLKLPPSAHNLKLPAASGTASMFWNCKGCIDFVLFGSTTGRFRNTFPLTISDSTFCSCRTGSRPFFCVFLMFVLLWTHVYNKPFQNLQSEWNAGRARGRKGEAQEFLNGKNLAGIKSNPVYIYIFFFWDSLKCLQGTFKPEGRQYAGSDAF